MCCVFCATLFISVLGYSLGVPPRTSRAKLRGAEGASTESAARAMAVELLRPSGTHRDKSKAKVCVQS